MIRNYFHSLHLILLVWISVDTGRPNCYSRLWPSSWQLFILSSFYCLPLQLFLLIAHLSLFPPFAHFSWWVPVLNGSLICQTALCFLEHICVPQAVNCWILHRVVAELARIFASELNQDFFFVACGKSELVLLYWIKGITAFKTIVATGTHLWMWGYEAFQSLKLFL